jgi:hypothetical protein
MDHALRLVLPLAAAFLTAAAPAAFAGERLPVVPVSDSGGFDKACPNYYRQGNDADVTADVAEEFCNCISAEISGQGLGTEVLDFLGRTYSEDLTTFMDQYPKGEAWMQSYFAAEKQCKENHDYGSNQPPADDNEGDDQSAANFPVDAGSWGGIVRAGPGQQYAKLTSLAQGEGITLLENTGIVSNDYPWFRIRYRGKREGYQWGGIICSIGDQVEGTFETCP